jgi:hypothetical protein
LVLTIPLYPEVADRCALQAEEDAHGYAVGSQQTDDSIARVCESW